MSLFSVELSNWQDWGEIFQSIPVFRPLVEHILEKEHLPMAAIPTKSPIWAICGRS